MKAATMGENKTRRFLGEPTQRILDVVEDVEFLLSHHHSEAEICQRINVKAETITRYFAAVGKANPWPKKI
jgi:hypothetical protein